MLGFLDLLALTLSLAVSLAIIVPLTGVLVRFRANYNPKGLQLDPEGGAQPHTGPIVKSYFGMMKRVYQIEGWPGLYKGLMPTFLSTSVVTVLIVVFMDTPLPRHGTYHAPQTGVLGTLVYSIGMMLIALPTAIVTYRAITTPHKLPYLNAAKSLRILLTPTERRRPWIIYLTPGLLAAEVSHVAIVVLALGPLRRLLLPPLPESNSHLPDVSPVRLAVYLLVVLVAAALLTPLEVMATRLAIQRNHASSEYNSISQEVDGDAEDVEEFSGAEEDVIGLRSEGDPYIGLADCAKRIINEEGWSALYRAWWITLLGTFSSGIAY
ncbi:mitochondrial carrier [Guyanagaster necrorhizus]|uniref:Mitochondrial carrier n=1 Tax=Guyanagaster necrorhizus TaxID=856835 RepID=A0A9P7VGA9_9AGAR|nr:mitochondrial carrier [Guyanagaster necrorhizus MCA 3950]KAG7440037.1 mitochondrial carrier [Guyanagaster necrorhizus MCA 3950]